MQGWSLARRRGSSSGADRPLSAGPPRPGFYPMPFVLCAYPPEPAAVVRWPPTNPGVRPFQAARARGPRNGSGVSPRSEAVDFEQPADRVLDLQLRGNKLHPGGEGRAHRLRCWRFDMRGTIVAEAHHLGDAAGVILVGFDRAGARTGSAGHGASHLEQISWSGIGQQALPQALCFSQ
jgi:hypothetical protein